MATSASEIPIPQPAVPTAFFRNITFVMGLLVLAGFSMQWLAGRSTFTARPLVHVHALIFMGWIAIFVSQASLATSGRIDVHRRLGKLAMLWVPLMVAAAIAIAVDVTRRGTAPFFFLPQYFVVANPMTVLFFAGFFIAAVRMRKRTDWHMRLQICATTCIMGPAFGRLLPMPLIIPYSYQSAEIMCLLFPIAGAIRDWRRDRVVHPAWWYGIAAIPMLLLFSNLIAYSSAGNAIYAWVTAGSPGASVPGLAFPAAPPL